MVITLRHGIVQEESDIEEIWPERKMEESYAAIVQAQKELFRSYNYNFDIYLNDYSYSGAYLHYLVNRHVESETIIFDHNGIPKVKYGDNYYYNPVTISQFALSQHAKLLAGQDTEQLFLDAIETLLSTQDEYGAFRYNFRWRYYLSGETYEEGWVSGMAQGQALSALTRAYLLTGDSRYFEAAQKGFQFLITPIEEGGTLTTLADLDSSLESYIFFEEYISVPNNYTLNGYLFTLLGVYDWWQLNEELGTENSKNYRDYFNMGMDSLVKVLPYYDIGGFSAYDLGHYTYDKLPHVAARYHLVHIYLLHALHSVTGEDILKFYERSWISYVN